MMVRFYHYYKAGSKIPTITLLFKTHNTTHNNMKKNILTIAALLLLTLTASADNVMDFRTAHAIGDSINSEFQQIKNATGYDHNWCLNTYKDGKGDDTQVCASLYSPKTGILMEMFTNEPGVQVYSGNFQGVGNEVNIKHKNNLVYPKHVSVCLESQKYPDSPNKKNWAQPTLNPGEKYFSRAAYKFSVKD